MPVLRASPEYGSGYVSSISPETPIYVKVNRWKPRWKYAGIVSMIARRTTIKDVAGAAGVGVATVSRVLSGGSASPETRERVLNVAAQLDYRPSALGRNLRQQRSGGIGLLLPDITDTFYGRLADGVLA